MAAQSQTQQEGFVANYVDQGKRRHRIVVRGRLVLDLCLRRRAVLIAELGREEGIDQARAVVFGGEFDIGYLARARAGQAPLGARLTAADIRERELAAVAEAEPDDGERLAA